MAQQSRSGQRNAGNLLRTASFNNTSGKKKFANMSLLGGEKDSRDNAEDLFGLAGLDLSGADDPAPLPKRRASMDLPRRRASMDAGGKKSGSALMMAEKNNNRV